MDNGRKYQHSKATWLFTLAAVFAATAQAQDGAAEADDAPSVSQPCLNHPTIRRTKVLGDRNIVFTLRDGTIYNNQLPRQCPSLRRDSVVNYAVENSRLCAGASFQVLWETSLGNYVPAFVCRLGSFVPITAAELDDLVAITAENRARTRRGRSMREAVTTSPVTLPRDEPATTPPPAPASP
jgi:hypothetical protein